MPKALDMTETFENGLARLMLLGISEAGNRSGQNLSHLEALGFVAMRLLVGTGAVQFDKLVDKALDLAATEVQSPAQLSVVRSNLNTAYNAVEELGENGATFHTIQ